VDPAFDRTAQQPVPGGIELDLVDPVAVAVVRAEDRRVALRPTGVLAGLRASSYRSCFADALDAPSPTLALERFPQRQIHLEQVDRLERRRLVQDGPGRVGDSVWSRVTPRLIGRLDRGHRTSSNKLCESWFTRVVNRDSRGKGLSCAVVGSAATWVAKRRSF
jgi:hypothetical protein